MTLRAFLERHPGVLAVSVRTESTVLSLGKKQGVTLTMCHASGCARHIVLSVYFSDHRQDYVQISLIGFEIPLYALDVPSRSN
jgi:hypothetical protein